MQHEVDLALDDARADLPLVAAPRQDALQPIARDDRASVLVLGPPRDLAGVSEGREAHAPATWRRRGRDASVERGLRAGDVGGVELDAELVARRGSEAVEREAHALARRGHAHDPLVARLPRPVDQATARGLDPVHEHDGRRRRDALDHRPRTRRVQIAAAEAGEAKSDEQAESEEWLFSHAGKRGARSDRVQGDAAKSSMESARATKCPPASRWRPGEDSPS